MLGGVVSLTRGPSVVDPVEPIEPAEPLEPEDLWEASPKGF